MTLDLGVVTGSLSPAGGGLFECMRVPTNLVARRGAKVSVYGLQDELFEGSRPAWTVASLNAYPITGPKRFGYSPEMLAAVTHAPHDLVHLHGIWFYPSYVTGVWRKANRKPTVVSPAGMLDEWSVRQSGLKKRLIRALYEDDNLRAAGVLHANSVAEHDAIRKFGLVNPVAILPNGVELPDLAVPPPPRPAALDGRKTLLFLGRIHAKKGLNELVQAWALLRDSEPAVHRDWVLTLAGWDDGLQTDLVARIAELGLQHSITVAGPVFGADKVAMLRHADAFILPSYGEGMPMAVLEAWSYGTPVIMTAACNLAGSFAAGAAIEISTDPAAMAHALSGALRDGPALRQIGATGRAYAERHHAWPSIVTSLEDVYGWLVGGGARPACIVGGRDEPRPVFQSAAPAGAPSAGKSAAMPAGHNARLRALHVIPSVSPKDGGPTRAIGIMERALVAAGVDVTTLTTDDDMRGVEAAGGPAIPARRIYAHKWLSAYKIAPGLYFQARELVRSFDVVHIHGLFSFASTAAAYAAMKEGVPYIIRPLGTLSVYGMQTRRRHLKRLSLAAIERSILENAAAVHFTSVSELDEARQLGINFNGVVIPHGIERDGASVRPPPPDPSGRRVVLFLSRLDRKKNLEALIEAFALSPKLASTSRLVVAGDGDPAYIASLKALASQSRPPLDIEWLGHVEGAAKSAVFQRADVFVLPSHSESFGIAPVEAMLEGVPCIVGHGVAIAAAIDAAGAGLAITPDAVSIARAVERLVDDQALRAAMSSRAVAFAEHEYSTTAMARRLVRLYESVRRNGRAPDRAPRQSGVA